MNLNASNIVVSGDRRVFVTPLGAPPLGATSGQPLERQVSFTVSK